MTDLTIYRGDNKTWTIAFTDDAGDPIDITGYTLFFTVKNKGCYQDDSADTNALIEKDVTVHTNPTGGISAVSLVPADTNTIEPDDYIYDMQLKDSTDNILTVIKGDFTITADVTRRTS